MAKVSEKRPYSRGNDWSPEGKRAYAAAYYERRKEDMKARARAHYHAKREAHQCRYLERKAAIAERNRLKREADPEPLRAAQRARYAASPDGAIARANKRRGMRLAAAVGTDREAYRAFVRSVRLGERIACHWCKRDVPIAERRIDHIIPLARGGSDDVSNLCASCRICNARKGDKMPDEWAAKATISPTTQTSIHNP